MRSIAKRKKKREGQNQRRTNPSQKDHALPNLKEINTSQDLIDPSNFSTIFKTNGVLRTPHHNLSN
jgi:hypothetical protein